MIITSTLIFFLQIGPLSWERFALLS